MHHEPGTRAVAAHHLSPAAARGSGLGAPVDGVDRLLASLLSPDDARVLVDRDARVRFASGRAGSLLGIGPGRTSLIDVVAPEDLPRLLAALASDDTTWHVDAKVRTEAGGLLPLQLRVLARVDDLWSIDVATVSPERALDTVLLDIASALLLGDGDSGEVITAAVKQLCEEFDVDRAAVFTFDTARPPVEGWAYQWARPGAKTPRVDADWWVGLLGRGTEAGPSEVRIADVTTRVDAQRWLQYAIASVLAVRTSIGGGYDVIIGMSMQDTARCWTDREARTLRSAAAIFGNAVRRAQIETALRAQRDAFEASEEKLRATLDATPAVIYRVDRDTTVLLANEAAARFGEIPADALVGLRLVDFLDADMAESVLADLQRAFDTGEAIEATLMVRTPARGDVWFDCRAVPETGSDGRVQSLLIFAIDTTARRAMETQIRRSAEIDGLTGLANRASLLRALEEVLADDPEAGSVAVLFVDLDRFKLTNDSLGHSVGDLVLQGVAEALRSCADEHDVVARLGGDEFAVALTGVRDIVDVIQRAERMRRAIEQPISVGNQSVLVTASIGVALVSPQDRSPADLLRTADIAMYQAKLRGRNRFEIFDDHLRREMDERLDTEAALRRAVPNRELEIHYQPEVQLDSGRIIGVEALARWRHPQRGLLPPAAFIGIAEETGVVADIGRAVLNDACRQVGLWAREHPNVPLTLRVNVSGRQLTHAGLLDDVTVAVAEAGIAPEWLCLEITETALMTDMDTTIRMLRSIRELGVKIAIDDFGTGYSSLGYLERFPIDALKIDRSFVSGIGVDAKSEAIVRTLMNLALVLDLDVVAEGVETEEQAAALHSLGCTRAQGFLYAPPLPVDELEQLLRAGAAPPGGRTSRA